MSTLLFNNQSMVYVEGADPAESDEISFDRVNGMAFHVAWVNGTDPDAEADPTPIVGTIGTLQIQAADEFGGTYADVAGATVTVAAEDGILILKVGPLDKQAVKVIYTPGTDSADGDLTAFAVAAGDQAFTAGPLGADIVEVINGAVFMTGIKIGSSQADAGAAEGEVYMIDTTGALLVGLEPEA
jgi:hypothetical protein